MARIRSRLPDKFPTTLLWPLAALGLLLLFNLAFTPGFFHIEIKDGRLFGSLIDILNRGAPVMLLAIGMSLVIATAGVDLSVGAVIAMAGATAVLLISEVGTSVGVAVSVALGVALIAGVWNGVLVVYIGIQPIVATLILMVAGRGVAQLLTNGQILTLQSKPFEFIGSGYLLGFPFSTILAAIFLALAALLTRRTALGLFIESVGSSETASRYAGINARLVKTAVYAVSGLGAGVAGLIIASDIKAADANNAGLWLELDAILAVVIGGTSLTGGRFYLVGSVVGALIIQTLTTTILSRGVAVEFTLVVKAIVVLAVCLLQSEAFRTSVGRRLGWKAS